MAETRGTKRRGVATSDMTPTRTTYALALYVQMEEEKLVDAPPPDHQPISWAVPHRPEGKQCFTRHQDSLL